jgi:flagellar biosynthesis protein FlhF
MIIKKYIVNDMKEAIIRAKYELGKDAVIISQRTVKVGKWYNLKKKKQLEVTVAVEENIVTKNNNINSMQNEYTETDLKQSVETDFIYEKASNTIKNKLVSYCDLYEIEDNKLTIEEKKNFLNLVLKNNCFEKKLELERINVFIGPTGVGKTTTIAKIAAKEHLVNKRSVGLLTMDTYRIGAVEQLKTYANILDAPFEVVNSPDEMAYKINKLKDCDMILIDTLGTSQRNKGKLIDIKDYLSGIEGKFNKYLVLSVSTDKDTTYSILDRYKLLNYDSLILTKFDEVTGLTNFWNIIENNTLPVQYFCFGQDVPDDIQDATLENLLDYIEENFTYA